MLQFTNFKKSYGSFKVLNITDTSLNPGIYWIKGKNGVGKSTLLKSIAGIIAFDGEIRLNDISLKKNGIPFRQSINFAEAEPMYPAFLTGKELIGFFETAKGKGKIPVSEMVKDMAMESYIGSEISSYSSGMLKKLSLVLAFIGNPKWILLDEPLNALDQESLQVLYQWIINANSNQEISFLLSSHQELDLKLLPFAKIGQIVSSDLILNEQ